ncbi:MULTISPECIES: site-specific integrase [Fusobacterium]|uniref:tyrosine-type recombinase/integrase n=1 Tax=Fusobacterium TaxID=848 RepID=UPI00147720CC|nr:MULTISPECIES: site-specific integrase [Fusobacterium]NME36468.1 site-specific integrase [Fusobacterium sp. FSA-380-WT-3A]
MDLVKYFLEELRKENIISENTINFYKSDLDYFQKFIKNNNLLEISKDELEEYLQHIKEKYSENSVIRKITSLKSFYKFLVKKEMLKTSPIDNISTSRKDIKVKKIIEERELKAIIDVCEDTKIGNRDKVIIKLLSETGLKIVDILGIELNQIRENNYRFFLVKQRNIYVLINLSEELSKELKEYVERYNIDSKFIFEELDNQKFKTNFLKYVKKANLDRNIVPSMIKNRCNYEREKINNYHNLDEIEIFDEIKREYFAIGIGDE